MKQFLKTCYRCKTDVVKAITVKDGVELDCLRCPNCAEEFFTSSELIKYDILKGKKDTVRKFGKLGDSTVMRFPTRFLKEFNISAGDYGVLEKRPDGILIRPFSAKDLKT